MLAVGKFAGYSVRHCGTVSPLQGLKVLDMSRVLAGPFCAMLLGDLGADVIKIEKPAAGDESRNWGPPFVNGQSCYFLSANRNKKSVAVDLKSVQGQEIIKKLAAASDVLIENFLPGKLDQLGLGDRQLREINPKLVYLSLTGFDGRGKYRERAGYDVIAASMGGLLHITGSSEGGPSKVGVAVTDLATALYAKGAILAALLQRARTGRGQRIECDLLSTQVSLLVNIASNYLNAATEAKRWGTSHESIVPYRAYQTLDGFITVAGASEKQFHVLCERLGLEKLHLSEKFSTNALRVANRKELDLIIGERFAQKTNRRWLEILEGCGIPYGPVNTLRDVFEDEEIARRMVVKMKDSAGGDVSLVGPAVRFSESLNTVRSAPPRLGEHTVEVLSDFYSASEIDELIKNKVVRAHSS